jgi:mannose-1-phosphate guanylyltransferase
LSTVRAVILAAGLGTRLRPRTDRAPKCLLPLAGRPLLDFWLDTLAEAGIREALVNTHAHADQVREYIERTNCRGGMRLTEFHEPKLLGSAGTLAANREYADDADQIVVIYADNLSDVRLDEMLAFHRGHGDALSMLLFRAENPRVCGIAELDAYGHVVSFVEKPQQPKSDLANAGVYVLDAAAYREIADLRAFDIGFDVLPKFIGRMRGWPLAGFHLDIGTPEAYQQAEPEAKRIARKRGFDAQGRRKAVFLDRDGTVIEHVRYLASPGDVRLLPGAAEALVRLRASGYATVLITNQSAIARGVITAADLYEIHEEMCRQLAQEGAVLDAIYHCPVAPQGDDRTQVEHPDRKPGPGMLIKAANELSLDLAQSWMIGDMISDVLAGQNAGCRGSLLVESGLGLSDEERRLAEEFPKFPKLAAAVDGILSHTNPMR